jgi:hypothetical protein
LAYVAKRLNEYGIQIREAGVVPDIERDIVAGNPRTASLVGPAKLFTTMFVGVDVFGAGLT